MSITDLITRIGIVGLKPNGVELSGPCPCCGTSGHNPKSGPVDRFNINLRTGVFLCRKCDIRGGDQVALVEQIMGYSFKDALTWLCGDKPVDIDPKELQRRRKKAAETQKRQDDYAAKARAKARKDAQKIWRSSAPAASSPLVRQYLEKRGITKDLLPALPRCLRVISQHRYVKKLGGEFITPHTGPCMIAAIQAPDGKGSAVHQTWLDISQGNGKAVIQHNGEVLGSKMVRGSKKSGAIRLITPEGADTLIMGEGIETTLTAMVANPLANAAYWVAVDLGNMSGKQKKIKGIRNSGIPDMTDHEAFVPPPWVKVLIFIMDGDSEAKMTRAKLECGLKRAMACRPGLTGKIVQAGVGVDLNDLLTRGDESNGEFDG